MGFAALLDIAQASELWGAPCWLDPTGFRGWASLGRRAVLVLMTRNPLSRAPVLHAHFRGCIRDM